MNLIQYIRFGYDFNYRWTFGIQWPFYVRRLPDKLKNQRHPTGKWKIKILPSNY